MDDPRSSGGLFSDSANSRSRPSGKLQSLLHWSRVMVEGEGRRRTTTVESANGATVERAEHKRTRTDRLEQANEGDRTIRRSATRSSPWGRLPLGRKPPTNRTDDQFRSVLCPSVVGRNARTHLSLTTGVEPRDLLARLIASALLPTQRRTALFGFVRRQRTGLTDRGRAAAGEMSRPVPLRRPFWSRTALDGSLLCRANRTPPLNLAEQLKKTGKTV